MLSDSAKHLDQLAAAQGSLNTNLREHRLDGPARSHMERALAHTEEAIVALTGRRCRSVTQLAHEKDAFDRHLGTTLRLSADHFRAAGDEGLEANNQDSPATLDDRGRRRQAVNLETAQAALRDLLRSHEIRFDARAHLERALNHVREAYIATNEIGRPRTVQRLVSDSEKVDLLFAKIRNSHKPEAKALKMRL
jgi:hypothetical protein